MIIQIVILLLINVIIISFIIYWIHLQYQEKLEQVIQDIEKEYDEIVTIIDEDWAYQSEVDDKRLYKKHLQKLKKELEEKNLLISYMQTHAKESRLYKKYFINNIKDNESKIN